MNFVSQPRLPLRQALGSQYNSRIDSPGSPLKVARDPSSGATATGLVRVAVSWSLLPRSGPPCNCLSANCRSACVGFALAMERKEDSFGKVSSHICAAGLSVFMGVPPGAVPECCRSSGFPVHRTCASPAGSRGSAGRSLVFWEGSLGVSGLVSRGSLDIQSRDETVRVGTGGPGNKVGAGGSQSAAFSGFNALSPAREQTLAENHCKSTCDWRLHEDS